MVKESLGTNEGLKTEASLRMRLLSPIRHRLRGGMVKESPRGQRELEDRGHLEDATVEPSTTPPKRWHGKGVAGGQTKARGREDVKKG